MKGSSIKKILIVAESIDVEDSSGTKGRVALIRNLHQAGFNIKVYHYTRKEIVLEGITCISIKENRNSLLFFLSRLERYTRYLFKIQFNKPLEKLFGFSFTLFNDRNSITRALKRERDFDPDLVITLSKGGSFRPHHSLLQIPIWHKRWMAYIHDPYPMHLYPRPFAWVEPGYEKKWRFINEVSDKAAVSAFPSVLLKEWMGSYFRKFEERGVVIPHQINFDIKEPQKLPYYFNSQKFILLHAGTLLGPRNPKILIQAFRNFLQKFPEAVSHSQLVFIGNTKEHSFITEEYLEEMKDNLIIKSSLDSKTVFSMQKEAAVNIILEAKSEISPFLPGKFPHCVKADKPILLLGPALSESRRLLGEDYFYWSEIDNSDRIERLIQALYISWLENPQSHHLNRPDLEEYLSEKRLGSVIRNLEVEK